MYGIYEDGQVIAQFVVPLKFTTNEPEFVSDALSLGRTVTRRTNQRWEIETRLDPQSYDANDLFVLLVTHGHHEPVEIVVPQNIGVIRKRTSTLTPKATGAKGATVVNITGNNGLIPKGTLCRFSNHSKIYMVKKNRQNDGALEIYPELRMAVADHDMPHLDDVRMLALFDTDTIRGMAFEDGVLQDVGTVKLIEKV